MARREAFKKFEQFESELSRKRQMVETTRLKVADGLASEALRAAIDAEKDCCRRSNAGASRTNTAFFTCLTSRLSRQRAEKRGRHCGTSSRTVFET